MNLFNSSQVLAMAVALSAASSVAKGQSFDAFGAIAGHPFQSGGSSILLRETLAPDVFELLVFVPSQVSPIVAGEWVSNGWVVVEDDLPFAEAGTFESAGTIQAEGVGAVGAVVNVTLSAIAGKAISSSGVVRYFSGALARSEIVVAGGPIGCPPVLFALPMRLHADLPMALAATAASAANAPTNIDDGGGPNNTGGGGVNQGCFDAAHGWEACYKCFQDCARDAERRRKVCRAACSYFDWQAIGVGGAGGAAVGAVCGLGILSAPAWVVGGVAGGLGGAIVARAACLTSCDSIRDAEVENCMDALVVCVAAH